MPKQRYNLKRRKSINLRAIDQETARVVGILGEDKLYVGGGCLLDGKFILTCYHVVKQALGDVKEPAEGEEVQVRLVGVADKKPMTATIRKLGDYGKTERSVDDLALLELEDDLRIPVAEFATPLRHAGKHYSVLGFPDGDPQGRNANGLLHAANADGLVQMDGNSALFVKGGFSGAPVWSSDLRAFVGIVVSELSDEHVAWCIPSRILCEFHHDLKVRFRIPPADRPVICDRKKDDPNIDLFGESNEQHGRKLEATVTPKKTKKGKKYFVVQATYRKTAGAPVRGGFVTFITYPDFKKEDEDAYELVAQLKGNQAEVEFYPEEYFTVAAIGDAGDTVLTLNLKDRKWRRR